MVNSQINRTTREYSTAVTRQTSGGGQTVAYAVLSEFEKLAYSNVINTSTKEWGDTVNGFRSATPNTKQFVDLVSPGLTSLGGG